MGVISNLLAILFFAVFCALSFLQIQSVKKIKKQDHGYNSMIGTALVGASMFTFRLVPGFRSWLVKYLHTALVVVGCYYLYKGQQAIKVEKGKEFKNIHAYPGYILYGTLIAHLLFAVLLFICIRSHRARFSFSALHDIFGVWLFTQLVGCCMAGMQAADKSNTKTKYSSDTIKFNHLTISSLILTTFVVLNPFFEWEMVDYI